MAVEAAKKHLMQLAPHVRARETAGHLAAVIAEAEALRTGDTCARQCEGTAYRTELRQMKALLAELLDQLGERDRGDGNAPGHAHDIPGIWDMDNGKLAGKPCAWCATWAKAKALGLMSNLNSTTPDCP
jgi:hypothetical protein